LHLGGPGTAADREPDEAKSLAPRRRPTLDAFAVLMRDQVDLDALDAELLTVVDQTMQPTQASLWPGKPAAAAVGTTVHGLNRPQSTCPKAL